MVSPGMPGIPWPPKEILDHLDGDPDWDNVIDEMKDAAETKGYQISFDIYKPVYQQFKDIGRLNFPGLASHYYTKKYKEHNLERHKMHKKT